MTQTINDVLAYLPFILTALGLLAFVVSLVVEVTKELPGIINVPTKLWTMIVSLVISLLLYFAVASYFVWAITWYFVFAVIIASFMVSFIATYGWESFNELYNRFKK